MKFESLTSILLALLPIRRLMERALSGEELAVTAGREQTIQITKRQHQEAL